MSQQEHIEHSDEHFGGTASDEIPVDRDELRREVKDKYAAVAIAPDDGYHFHTGRLVAERCRYDLVEVDALPPVAVESFAGVANPFEHRPIGQGERIVDLGAGAGMDSFLAARAVGPAGHVIGVDMTPAMLAKARTTASLIAKQTGVDNVEFRDGYLEDLPVDDEWADVVIANGVVNLCPDKFAAFGEAWRVLRPGGRLQFADIANGNEVPEDARRHIDLWTG